MQNFSNQCTDLARSLLGNNLKHLNEDGTVTAAPGEPSRVDEPGHAALAIGEFFRATGEVELEGHDLSDLDRPLCDSTGLQRRSSSQWSCVLCPWSALLCSSKERNPVWERLTDPTREQLDECLLERVDYKDHFRAFNVAKSVARFSFGLTKKDDTGKVIDRFVERIQSHSSGGFCNDNPEGPNGVFNIYGLLSFIFIRQALQLHANVHLKDRKLPKLRTFC